MTLWKTREERQKAHKERIAQSKAIIKKKKRARRKFKRRLKYAKTTLKSIGKVVDEKLIL